ncbi:MAG TPA: class I SAM-dependent methyltransferase [Desulfobulbus sp.]|nr:class I SAM-dependent methyltransferase [Desulfobulbus sp.]
MTPQHAAKILRNLFPENTESTGSITLWNGDHLIFGTGQPKFDILIKDSATFENILTQPSLGFGEGYVDGAIEITGHLGDALEWLYRYEAGDKLTPIQKARICWLQLKKKATLSQSRADVQFHYDKGNDFYTIWLDKGMNYSCAFFTREDEGLEEAQVNKIHRSLKKLRLRPGHTFLDIGCGWGSPLMEAVTTFGARKAVGLTLSKNQYELGNQRIQEAGLADKAEIRLQDYREIPEKEFGTFDRILSIGMFEHVGQENMETFFKTAAGLLKNQGIFLLHTIGRSRKLAMDPWIIKYIFPGTYLPSLGELATKAQKKGFDLVDVENLRQHYDRTLGHWAVRFEKNIDRIGKYMDAREQRMWLFYLYGCQMGFRYNPMHVFQMLYSKGRRHDWPLVREELYAG